MHGSAAQAPVGEALDVIERDVLPSLSALLHSVASGDQGRADLGFETKSAQLREMNRQIIELTRFLAAVTADANARSGETKIPA